MKKLLLTTTAIAFAGSTMAADVAGSIKSAYYKTGDTKSLKTKADVKISG